MLSGVSICIVSRALRGLPNVSDTSHAKVADAAARLGYVASSAASRLAGGSTGSIAIIAPTTTAWFFDHAGESAEEVSAASGHNTRIISLRNNPAVRHRRFGDLAALAQKGDGVLLLNIELTDAEIEALAASPLAVVSVGMHNVPWDNVGIDNVAAARAATEHLLDLGHWGLAILSGREKGNRSVLTATERRHGLEPALASRDLVVDPDLAVDAGSSIERGQQAMNELIENRRLPSAIFAGCDETAFGAMTALREHGLSAPRNVSIIGLDGHPMSRFMSLSTVQQPVADHGAFAANLLEERPQNPDADLEPAHHVLPTTLLTRKSTRRKR